MPMLWPVLFTLWTATPPTPRAAQVPVTRSVPRRDQLHAGDLLTIRVWRVGSALVTVDERGKIRHPLFGELDVTGWSEQDLRDEIQRQHDGAPVHVGHVSVQRR